MSHFNMPPGVTSNMIPGNRAEDEAFDAFVTELQDVTLDPALSVALLKAMQPVISAALMQEYNEGYSNATVDSDEIRAEAIRGRDEARRKLENARLANELVELSPEYLELKDQLSEAVALLRRCQELIHATNSVDADDIPFDGETGCAPMGEQIDAFLARFDKGGPAPKGETTTIVLPPADCDPSCPDHFTRAEEALAEAIAQRDQALLQRDDALVSLANQSERLSRAVELLREVTTALDYQVNENHPVVLRAQRFLSSLDARTKEGGK